ncbi:GPR19 protein, partial [Scytalopus superciliaris]|nr:GPR19 protein [Scytalopus superciliaris]
FAQSMDNSSNPFLLATLLILLQNVSNPETSTSPAGYEMTESPPTGPGSSRNHTLLDYGLTPGEIAAASMVWGVLWLVSVLGNFLICLVIHRSRRTQSTTNYFVVSMACADLLSTVMSAPFLLLQLTYGRWILGNGMCKLVRYIQYLTPEVQIHLLFTMGVIQRYSLIYPLSFKMTREKAKKTILASLLCGALWASPACFLYGSNSDHHCNFFLPHSCEGVSSSISDLAVLLFIVQSIYTVCFYKELFTYIWRKGIENMTGRRTKKIISRKVKTVKMFLIFSSVFLLSWLPFYMVQVWHPQETDYRNSSLVFLATTWISFSSSASKPILFYIYNADFRRRMKEICCLSARKYHRSNTFTITTSSRTTRKYHV